MAVEYRKVEKCCMPGREYRIRKWKGKRKNGDVVTHFYC